MQRKYSKLSNVKASLLKKIPAISMCPYQFDVSNKKKLHLKRHFNIMGFKSLGLGTSYIKIYVTHYVSTYYLKKTSTNLQRVYYIIIVLINTSQLPTITGGRKRYLKITNRSVPGQEEFRF